MILRNIKKPSSQFFLPDTILQCVGIFLLFRIMSYLFVHNSQEEYIVLTIETIVWIAILMNIGTKIYSIFIAKKEIRTPIFWNVQEYLIAYIPSKDYLTMYLRIQSSNLNFFLL